jgi:hypothetical protein
MLRTMLPPGVTLFPRCSGLIAGDNVESLTLIANELIINAAKHAFQDRHNGQIILGYREEGAGWRLWVHDDGCGRSPSAAETSASFGNLLIETLAARLNTQHSACLRVRRRDETRRIGDKGDYIGQFAGTVSRMGRRERSVRASKLVDSRRLRRCHGSNKGRAVLAI